jgi:hypothetical protein
MTVFRKPLDQLMTADIHALIAHQVPEGKTLDYKRDHSVATDQNKREFLADVSSFANTAGGHLILGVDESGGLPTAAPGIEVLDEDKFILQLESILRTGVAPRLPLVRFKCVGVGERRCVVVVQVGRSWTGPHMVTHSGSSRFWAHGEKGKFELDVHQLRTAFLGSEEAAKRMSGFRTERVARVISDTTVAPLMAGAKIVAHMLPLESFAPRYSVDLTSVHQLTTMPSGSDLPTPNFEGIVALSSSGGGPSNRYLQVFRNGCLEAVDGWTLLQDKFGQFSGGMEQRKCTIPSTSIERNIVQFVKDGIGLLFKLGVPPPAYACFSLVGIRGHQLAAGMDLLTQPIQRDDLILPEVLLEHFEPSPTAASIAQVLRPAFDVFWNAFGKRCSRNYNEQGEWTAENQ